MFQESGKIDYAKYEKMIEEIKRRKEKDQKQAETDAKSTQESVKDFIEEMLQELSVKSPSDILSEETKQAGKTYMESREYFGKLMLRDVGKFVGRVGEFLHKKFQ